MSDLTDSREFYEATHQEMQRKVAQGLNSVLKPEAPADWVLAQCLAVLEERGKHYTKGKERNWVRITEVFNALTGRNLSCKEALLFMVVLKLVRATGDPTFNLDHYVDGINYLALAGESAAVE